MEEYKRKYSEVAERLMERNRQYQKLQGLYDSLRLRNMVVAEREEPARRHHLLLHPGEGGEGMIHWEEPSVPSARGIPVFPV